MRLFFNYVKFNKKNKRGDQLNMRNDKMGRKRKDLVDKSTSLILRVDNKTLFLLCNKLNIEFDSNAESFDDETKKRIIMEIKEILNNFVK